MAAFMFAIGGYAQSDDFGIWTSIEAQKKINKKFSVALEGELRTRDNVKTNDRWSIGLDASYKLTKWLKASAGYTFLYDNNERISYYEEGDRKVESGAVNVGDPKKRAEYWAPRHRFNVSLTASQSFGNLEVSLRERWQYTYRPEKTVSSRYSYWDEEWDEEEHSFRGKGKNVLRSRLQLEYKLKSIGLTPYANVELYNAWDVQKTRYTIGTEYKITKQHAMEFFYRYQDIRSNDDFEPEPDMHILGIGYKFKF
ncbi:MAG: DUF2490 domain-containing protein [Prevotella sp.]|nr:DUF2490 domain-containing protein [Prevotella sp.]